MLFRGNAINKETLTYERYDIKFVERHQLKDVLLLQEYIYELLPIKEIFVKDTEEELIDALERGGKIFGVFNEEQRLISYRFISFPNASDKNMGREIGLQENELSEVVHLETTLVHPDYRGNQLQKKTLEVAVKYIEALGYRHLICTVSPYNIFSLTNIIDSGLQIKALKKKYGTAFHEGYLRYILHKDLVYPIAPILSESKATRIDDFDMQKKLIKNGYIGYKVKKDVKKIEYAQIVSKTSSNTFQSATFVS